ncbi:MAG: hypothetical protein KIT22_14210, partial [Verrucomicrobiae bacterium]|nr:hypothetical protein [Verrucomicrobiae bacterium]
YPHSGPAGQWGAAIIGGYVYRGTEFAAELGGRYVFGDNIANVIWVLDESTIPAKKIFLCSMPRGSGPNAGNDYVGLSGFGYDHQNELYLCQLSSQAGRIYKLQRGGTPPKPLPPLLSQTGAFSDLATLAPSSGLVHYEVNSPLWSDGAHKTRWMGVPDGAKIGFATNGEWTFPAGSVWVKHFELSTNENDPGQRRRLETRLLVRDTNNYVYGASYKWRPDYSDAEIVQGAVTEDIEITGAQQIGELTSVDIGGPVAGSTTKQSDGWQLVAGGADIWGTSDQFRFAYQERSGDFDIFVKIASVTQTDLYTKAGLMVRDSLNANARHLFALVFPSNAARNNNDGGYEFQSRDTVGGSAAAIYPPAPSPRFAYPNTWLRLKRAGNVWTAYSSDDGRNWRLYATKILALPDTVYFGLALTAHTGSGARATAKFDFRERWQQPWFFPGRQDCLSCHSHAAGGVLGVKTRQSHREHFFTETGVTDNQLRAWNHAGYFEPALDEAQLPNLTRMVTVTNEAATLEFRVRSYLDANCSHCHRPGGPAGQAKWDARIETPLGAAQILGGPVLDTLGVAGSRIVVPKDLEHSVLFKRLSTATESYRMPPLAKNLVDPEAVSAVAAWILDLSGLPEVALQSPSAEALFLAPAKIVLTAQASTTNGSITRVEFYTGDTKLGEATEPPYQATWNVTAGGAYEVRALATDSSGITGASSPATVTVLGSAGGGGLLGEYYDNINFTTKTLTRVDPTVNFDWGNGSPAPEVGADTFSVRWTGTVTPRFTETYTFIVTVDDGVRLWVNNQLLINQWIDQSPTTYTRTIALQAGQAYPIRMDFYENGGGAVAQLRWRSARQSEQAIPASALRPPLPDNQAPTVRIVSPAGNQSFLLPDVVTLSAEVNDSNGNLSKVEFFANGFKLGETTDAPFRLPWVQPSAGDYILSVQATDEAGVSATAAVNVQILAFTLQPTTAEDGRLHIRAVALNGQSYRLETSSDLSLWTEVSVAVGSGGQVEFVQEVGADHQFFRLIPLP